MTPCVVAFEDGEREAGNEVQVDFVRSEADGGMDKVVAGGLGLRDVKIPVILSSVHKHEEPLGEVWLRRSTLLFVWGCSELVESLSVQEFLNSA